MFFEKYMNIAVTGYVGTGSSAMIDLLREYDGVNIVPEQRASYEHQVFYRSGGLFDLLAILGHGTSPVCSDQVINHFIDTMNNLYQYDYVWYGGYKNLVGDEFKKNVDDFVSSISYKFAGTNSTHQTRTYFSIKKTLLQFAAHIIYKKNFMKYGVGYKTDGKPSYVSIPSADELQQAAVRFTSSYFKLFDSQGYINVFDHLIWPQQIENYTKYFNQDDLKIIVLVRDPRDVFLLNKYVWYHDPRGKRLANPSLRTNVEEFAHDWKRTFTPIPQSKNILKVQFEDMIYRYDDTIKEIEAFIGLSDSQHVGKKTKFDPEKSIENTQVFNSRDDWRLEVEGLLSFLSDYIYDFPYIYTPERKLMFD